MVLAVQRSTGSFAVAGTAAGAFVIAHVLAAPWRARAIDRWGQRRVLLPLCLAQVSAFLGYAFAANSKGTSGFCFVALSVAVGLSSPPISAAMRNIWVALTDSGQQRSMAFSLDSIADDLVYIVGPVVAAFLATTFLPSSALLAAGAASLTGTIGLTTSTESGRLGGTTLVLGRAERPLRRAGFMRALVVLVGVGCVLGTIEISAPAVATASHQQAASGWVLAAVSAGSAIGGLLYGHISWRVTLGTRMLALAIGMGALTCGVGFVRDVPVFAVGLALIGFFLSPSIITGYLAAEQLVPRGASTEASVWTNTAVNLGASVANGAAGGIIATSGVTSAMLAAGGLAVVAATCAPRAYLGATKPDSEAPDKLTSVKHATHQVGGLCRASTGS
jgi:MFS family permease